jgi:hypothetical protein
MIDLQPTGRSALEGSATSLQVFAHGEPPLSFQWRHGLRDLPGQTNAMLRLNRVSSTDIGAYSVVVSNQYGASLSSNVVLEVIPALEQLIGEINFKDKPPLYNAIFNPSEQPATVKSNIAVLAGAGIDGAPALVGRFNGSSFTNDMNQEWAMFGVGAALMTSNQVARDLTNLDVYRLEATVRTTGLLGTNAQGRVLAEFLTNSHIILTREFPVMFTTNYQVYSCLLGDGQLFKPGNAWSDFVNHFPQINSVACLVSADRWLDEYDLGQEDGFDIANVKLWRLVPDEIRSNRKGEASHH